MRFVSIVSVASLTIALCGALTLGEEETPEQKQEQKLPDYSAQLPEIPSKSPAEAIEAFAVLPPFTIEAAATEPLVTDPVAMAFDKNGQLYVVEMRDYSQHEDESLGEVRLLADENGDGTFDAMTIFAEHLSWPSAIICWDGGVFVGAPPDVFYLKDTDGDGKSDVRKLVFTGFSRSNVQGMMNSFRWGLDNRIHGAGSTTGGKIVPGDNPEAEPIVLGRHDFAFNPRTLDFEITTASAQHGMCFDDWGHKFVSSNSDHIQQVMYEGWLIARNPYLKAPGGTVTIAADGAQAPVFRTSRVEPWRVLRTRLRVNGVVPGPVEKGGKASGYFSSATGVTIYRGDAWPQKWLGAAIIGDVGSNLIHRKTVETDTLPFIARRADEGVEFITSTDTWFRPVQFKNGPDGALYVADFYRQTIEHPESLPPAIKMHLDLDAGNKMGRIYRIAPEGFDPRPTPHLGEKTTAELVGLLDHPNGWHRVTASRLLYQRQDDAAIAPLKELAATFDKSSSRTAALGRMHALDALAGLDALSNELIIAALDDPHKRVRENAVKLALERADSSPAIARALLERADDEAVWVRYQVAFALGEVAHGEEMPEGLVDQAVERLGDLLLDSPDNRWMHIAALSSLAGFEATVLADHEPTDSSAWSKLAATVARRGKAAELARVADRITKKPKGRVANIVLDAWFADPSPAVRRVISDPDRQDLAEIVAARLGSAIARAKNPQTDVKKRVAAVQSLRMAPYETAEDLFETLAVAQQPIALQKAAINLLRRYDSREVAEQLIEAWPSLSPPVRDLAAEALTSSKQSIRTLLTAIEGGEFSPRALPQTRRRLLRQSRDPEIRQRAKKALAATALDERAEVVARYQSALKLMANAKHGQALFQEHCSICHKIGDVGHAIGPNLTAIRDKGPSYILLNVLAPSREVNPQFVNYVIVTKEGRVKTGLIASESPTAVTLKREEGKTETILRLDIEAMRSTGKSLMPDGLEQKLGKQEMADLIAYLMSLE